MCGRMRVCWSEEAWWRWPGAGGSQNRRRSSSTTRSTGKPDFFPLPRVGNKNPLQKITLNTQKKPPKKPLNRFFWEFFKFLIFYENNTNFSL
jgi:hypothetical protein